MEREYRQEGILGNLGNLDISLSEIRCNCKLLNILE